MNRRGFLKASLTAPAAAFIARPEDALSLDQSNDFAIHVEYATGGGTFSVLGDEIFLPPLITNSIVQIRRGIPLKEQFSGHILSAVEREMNRLGIKP